MILSFPGRLRYLVVILAITSARLLRSRRRAGESRCCHLFLCLPSAGLVLAPYHTITDIESDETGSAQVPSKIHGRTAFVHHPIIGLYRLNMLALNGLRVHVARRAQCLSQYAVDLDPRARPFLAYFLDLLRGRLGCSIRRRSPPWRARLDSVRTSHPAQSHRLRGRRALPSGGLPFLLLLSGGSCFGASTGRAARPISDGVDHRWLPMTQGRY